MEKRRALYIGLFIVEGVFVAFLIVVTIALYLSNIINATQLVYRSACLILIPLGAAAGTYRFAGRSLSRAFNASAALLLALILIFILNSTRHAPRREPIETTPPEEKLDPQPTEDDVTASASDPRVKIIYAKYQGREALNKSPR